MSLLYTQLRDNPLNGVSPVGDIPVYEITNIFDYLSANNFAALNQYAPKKDEDDHPEWAKNSIKIGLNEIPNVFAPFPEFWMEYSYSLDGESLTCGHHFWTEKDGDNWYWGTQVWMRDSSAVYSANEKIYLKIDASGHVAEMRSQFPESGDKDWMRLTTSLGFCIVAISFLNMHRNSVRVASNPPSRQQRRHAQRKGTKPPPDFKTILVRGMGKSYGKGNGGKGDGKPYALHIVRGHMLTVTQSAPLFG